MEAAWVKAQSRLSQLRTTLNLGNSQEQERIIRVGQLDSELLDQELAQLLQEPINKSLALINVRFKAHFQPELNLLIRLTLYKLSIWNNGASYGAKLQDLKYVVLSAPSTRLAGTSLPRKALLLHMNLTLFLPYIHDRIRLYALSNSWPDSPSSDRRKKAWDLLCTTEAFYSALALANFISFLWNGRYRTIADRLLKMSLFPSRKSVTREVSYEFMNRQMVWHAFTEFLLFLLPLTNSRTIRRKIFHIRSLFSESIYSLLPSANSSSLSITDREKSRKRGKLWSLPFDECAICFENGNVNPLSERTQYDLDESSSTMMSDTKPPKYPIYNLYQTSCGHNYCYHCIAERMLQSSDDNFGWECLRCGDKVKEARRLTVEKFESEVSGSEYEFSSDLDVSTDLSGSMGSFSESVSDY